jgi:hypothetical protein
MILLLVAEESDQASGNDLTLLSTGIKPTAKLAEITPGQ